MSTESDASAALRRPQERPDPELHDVCVCGHHRWEHGENVAGGFSGECRECICASFDKSTIGSALRRPTPPAQLDVYERFAAKIRIAAREQETVAGSQIGSKRQRQIVRDALVALDAELAESRPVGGSDLAQRLLDK